MATVTNPIYGMLPTMNPTGNQVKLGSVPGTTPSPVGSNPLLPNASLSPGSAAVGPLGIVPGTSPTFPANTGGYPSSTNLGQAPGAAAPGSTPGGISAGSLFGFGNMTPKDTARLFDSLKKTYGDGMAHLILDFLQGGAGFNQQAVNNLLASLQPGIERGEEDLLTQFSSMGDRFSSGAEIGLGDFLSQVNLNEGQLVTQMYENSLNNFINVLMGTSGANANRIASSPSVFDSILGGVGLGANIGGSIMEGASGGGGFADIISSILGGLI